MKVTIDELEKITSLLFIKLRKSVGFEIEISNDFYWDVSDKEIFNPYKDPQNISLGQLSDDLEEILRLCKSDEDVIIYDLKRLSSILRAICIENSSSF